MKKDAVCHAVSGRRLPSLRFAVSEQELLVRQTARRFVDERVLPLIRDCFATRFPLELIPEMAELGFLGANLEGSTAAPA
jgi:alkylation response protein AidB-like acyl-CoA dehydrogenase